MSASSKMGHNIVNDPMSCSNETTHVKSNSSSHSSLIPPLDANATSINCDEQFPLLGERRIRSTSTWYRFYILLLFSFFAILQNVYFNNFSPIADSMEVAMGWNDRGTTVAWLSNVAAISYLPGTLLFYLITNYLGLRCGVVIGILLVCVCGILRCFIFTFSTLVGTILLFFAQFLNGLAGPVVVSATTQLSANWFPSNERNIATAISGQASNIGISFILGPLLVPDVNTSFISSHSRSDLTDSILLLLYIEAAAPVAVFALIVLYFPSRPKSAPTISATVERLNFVATVKSYTRNYPLILLSLCYAVPVGITVGWFSFLYPNLRELSIHVTQDFVGWLGFYMTIAGVFGSLIFSKIADCFPRRKKLLVVSLYTLSSVMLVLFSLICTDVFHIGNDIYILLTTTSIICGVFVMGIDPILKEMIVEVGFPIAEFNSILVASFVYNLITILFLATAGLSSIGTSWINWLQSGVYIATTFVLLFIPISHPRLDRDTS